MGLFGSKLDRCLWWGELGGWPKGIRLEREVRCHHQFGRVAPTGGRTGTPPNIIFEGDYTLEAKRYGSGSGQTAPKREKVALGLERYLPTNDEVGNKKDELDNLVGPPDFTPLVVAALVAIIAYAIWTNK